jgi:hypothetical protein
MLAVLNAVAEAPPPRFSGGGMWEAMHGEMAGFYDANKERRIALNTGCSVSWITLTQLD